MNKNPDQLKKRKDFIKKALNDKQAAAQILRDYAIGIENCRTTQDIVYALKEILFLSEPTIYRDFN